MAVIGAGAVWRSTGLKRAGRSLVRATYSDDEQIRTLGGMMLVQAGERSVDLVLEAAEQDELNPTLVEVLGDIGGQKSETVLVDIAQAGGPLAQSAERSLERMKRIERLDEEEGM